LRIPYQPSAVRTVWRPWKMQPRTTYPAEISVTVPRAARASPRRRRRRPAGTQHDHDVDDPRGDPRDPPMVRFPFGAAETWAADAVICGSSGRGLAHR
jgi:hypothetical protein